MSNAVSVVGGASFEGTVAVADAGVKGMITLRGDLNSGKLAKALKSAVGTAVPTTRRIELGKSTATAWMSPDELLILCDYTAADEMVAKLEKALNGEHFLAVNVSDARAQFTLSGTGVREVLAKGSPADLSPEAWPLGEMRRTRLGQIAVAFWMTSEDTAELICFRSMGKFVWDWLNVTARDEVPGYF